MVILKEVISETKAKLLRDLPKFLFLEGKEQYFFGVQLDVYATSVLESLQGKYQQTEDFSKLIDILYGCQQLDDFGESWAPTKEKIEGWISFLKKFR